MGCKTLSVSDTTQTRVTLHTLRRANRLTTRLEIFAKALASHLSTNDPRFTDLVFSLRLHRSLQWPGVASHTNSLQMIIVFSMTSFSRSPCHRASCFTVASWKVPSNFTRRSSPRSQLSTPTGLTTARCHMSPKSLGFFCNTAHFPSSFILRGVACSTRDRATSSTSTWRIRRRVRPRQHGPDGERENTTSGRPCFFYCEMEPTATTSIVQSDMEVARDNCLRQFRWLQGRVQTQTLGGRHPMLKRRRARGVARHEEGALKPEEVE